MPIVNGPIPNQSSFGAFIPTTYVWDIGQIYSTDIKSPEFKELIVRLYQNMNNMALLLNLKDTGYYILEEYANSQQWFKNPSLSSSTSQQPQFRGVFRKVINFGALPNAATKTVAHVIDITSGYSFTRIYGAATKDDQTSFIPLPFSSPTLNENIKLEVTATDISITTDIDYSDYDTTYVIVEYIKQ